MLKLKGITSPNSIQNESDFYVRIKIMFESQHTSTGPTFYWSTIGPKDTFIEIGIKEFSGTPYDITVVSMPQNYTQKRPNISANSTEKIGLPLFDVETYLKKHPNEHYFRESQDFEVYVDQQRVVLLFSSNKIITTVINDPIVFGFDSNNFLCSIEIKSMTLNEEGFLQKIEKSS